MTSFRLHRTTGSLMLALLALSFSACDFGAASDAFNEFKILIGLEKQPTNIGVAFVDAATGNPIAGDFKVGLSGSGAIVDIFGDPITTVDASQGQFTFALSKAATPTNASPVTVRVEAAPAGYLPVSERVVISDTGIVTVAFRALRPSAPSQGTQVAQTSNTATASGTATPIAATTPATPPPSGGQAPPQASIAAPAGTQVRSASGQALTGSVTTTIVAVNPNVAASLELLPAGLQSAGIGKNAAATNVIIGAMNLSFTVGTTPGASLTNGTLTIDLPSTSTVNPATGQPWVAGQTIDLYRYLVSTDGSFNTGSWLKVGTITVRAKTGGGWQLSTTLTPLLTGWYAATVTVPTTVSVPVEINRNGNTGGVIVTINQPGYTSDKFLTGTQSQVTFADVPVVPAGTRMIEVLFAGVATTITAPASGTVTLTLPAPNPDVTVTVTPSCGLGVAQLPAIFVSVREQGKQNFFSLGNVSSQAEVTRTNNLITKLTFRTKLLKAGTTYEVSASSGSSQYSTTATVTGATSNFTYEVDPGLCG